MLQEQGNQAVRVWPCGRFFSGNVIAAVIFGLLTSDLVAADPEPTNPDPTKTSTVGMTVNNPVTSAATTVSALVVDPSGTATAGAVAFVKTADGYIFLVKEIGEVIYNGDSPPQGFLITAKDTTTKIASLTPTPPDPDESKNEPFTLSYQALTTDTAVVDLLTPPPGSPGAPAESPEVTGGAAGIRLVGVGSGGSNGRNGALFVPPSSGGNGSTGPTVTLSNNTVISANNQIGIEIGSVGGSGGRGGSSYASFWSGRKGGDGAAGGVVNLTNNISIQVATTGNNMHGIFAYSRSGAAGNGGSGYLAPGGGSGGASSDGGNVTVTNHGNIITTGDGAIGIYALSVGNKGGSGGSQWGIVGQGGSAGTGGNGGNVVVTNSATGTIHTSGNFAHGIQAQSIGGSGGSSGTTGNLILSLQGASDNGGNGGSVIVNNSGLVITAGSDAKGIFAQSIGGGGGSGGSSGGLIALGGSGSNGGSANTVAVYNYSTGRIETGGLRSDAVFAQSVGGSGGSGSNAGGLVAVGGSGSQAGNGAAVTVENYGTILTAGDFSRGIVAQSIGGGGGDGGSTGGMVAVGGSGAGGGIGSTVTIKNGGSITTLGDDARAIMAQSVGGGGGNGGSAGSFGLFAGVAVGGNGSTGGVGGNVNLVLQGQDVNTASLISTAGDRSTGIFAQSVGGGGGSGGGAVQVTAGFGVAASFAVGGSGGQGGAGGTVSLTKGPGLSVIETGGDDSLGVSLQSVGGGGGNGAYAVSVAVSGGPASGSLSVGIGGSGGVAGAGGTVTVGAFSSNLMTATGFNGSILTSGDRSTGFLAQSVGGGGGNGGLGVGAAGSGSLLFSGSIGIGLGGSGGGGGAGGTVSVGTQGNITTEGDHSVGLLTQSVGGGGGNGGGSIAASLAGSGGGAGTMSLAIGGNAGSASTGGLVTVATRTGTVTTRGENSSGIVIQSVGGGGGNGGYSIAAGAAGAGVGAGAVNVGLGGSGGGGGAGGTVMADLQSNVVTTGLNSSGIAIQSAGGGGGNGGFNIAAGAAGASTGSGAVSVGLGGSGASGGIGGSVTASSTGAVTTFGDNSGGIIAQSLGGGGGNGGYSISVAGSGAGVGSGAVTVGLGGSGGAGNHGGLVTLTTSVGRISTGGANSTGILAQSVGGGGGNGGYNVAVAASGAGAGSGAVSVGLGGSGGSAGNAGKVTLTVNNEVSTAGANSAAVVAQAIGGGGGNGGFNVSGAGSGGGVGSGGISVGLGGGGSSGGTGGEVEATVTGNIQTLLENSVGLLAQSIGGGGGNGGFNIAAGLSGAGTGSGSIAVGLGGSGSGGGSGLKVQAASSGTIRTWGNNSTAFIAQSIGGGGGNGGFNVSTALSGAGTGSGAISVGLGGGGGGAGNGGMVIAQTSGNIQTDGDSSGGILAQSVGGGGGNGGFNVNVAGSGAGTGSGSVGVGLGGTGAGGGFGDTVNLTVSNNVRTAGRNAFGIIAQSLGGGGGNGGFDITAALSGAGTGSGAVGVSIGGSGGGGGYGSAVTTTVTGNVVTAQSGSGGILSQSAGGGGGNGGMSISGALSFAGTGSGAVSVGLGGSGGTGGHAGKVSSTVEGDVYTGEADSFGVAAQSLGGGGGNGGISISGALSMAKSGSGALAIGLGGSGGGGGDADEVDNTVTGYVQTLGDNSIGILSQSLGGGGGNGGLNISGVISAAKTGSGAVAVGIGGSGGSGGDGQAVVSRVVGGVVTTGNFSTAILSQSLGGGGGTGALNVSGALNITKENGGSLGVGIGGFGGDGGNGGNVNTTVRTTPTHTQIGTIGDNASALVAQSLGGGGGNGGTNITGVVNLTGKNGAAIGVGVGGFGGSAGDAGIVTVDAAGQIVTQGNLSHGLLAQSIGGGGGNGGTNVSGTLALTNSSNGSATTVAASIGVGGFGGGGGKAGAVDVKFDGTIFARPGLYHAPVTDPITGELTPGYYENLDGAGSHGLAAQSIGGGGGNGGINVSGGISYARGEGDAYGVMVGVGGFGGTGGEADRVDVLVTGGESITAYGAGHSAILAQSVGGGGGNGGTNVSGGIVSDSALIVGVGGFAGNAGVAKNVAVTAASDLFASALESNNLSSAGIMAQSIGGGGGNGGLNVSGGIGISKESTVPSVTVGIGGFGGDGAVSGEVMVNHGGTITTSGNWIHGIAAQSIAGGGGNGALNVSGQINFADSENSGGKKDMTIVAGIGGNGGTGANAGDVNVTQLGTITTAGDHARGVLAQSIGGGGGTGGMNVTGVFAKNSSPVSVGVGGSGTGGGHAGMVQINRGMEAASTGKVTTSGVGAHGIEASSIGGGGGDAGMNFIAGFTQAGKGEADPGFAANFAIGGAGGEAGHGGSAKVFNYSDIETMKTGSHGLIAQSIGGGGGNANLNLAVVYAGAAGEDKENKNLGFNFALGGAPGDGGNGGEVEVVQAGRVETHEKGSIGILAQSIGGGGGNASLDVAYTKVSGGKAGITLGRVGGTGGYGSNVTLTSDGIVITHGDDSYGIQAQSIGNGGGNSSSTSVSIEGPETTEKPANGVAVSVGLEGGEGGRGGNVLLNASGWVQTSGRNSHAVFAQSIGGGGGNGGSANTLGLTSATAALSLGGTGGTGGVGGTVVVNSSADVRTAGESAIGILAQSVGGGGGTGGMARSGGFQSKVDGVTVAVGGSGGEGMSGDAVTVQNSGIIITGGLGSHGILAQSLGGGGGNSGMAINSILKNAATNTSNRAAITIGGSGGDGAVSGDVTVTNTGGIGTVEAGSIGIFAQSIGGGGGNASTVITSTVAGDGGGNSFGMGIGGDGGNGAAAGDVKVFNRPGLTPTSGQIITIGDYSHGILAMSVGGGGGTGATTVTTQKSKSDSATATTNSFSMSLGGNGGDGGTGGVVEVENEGKITTYGYKAHGIIAQSVGGGGGSGGMTLTGDMSLGKRAGDASGGLVGSFALGGFGGTGNSGGTVSVNNSGTIEVFGKSSYGIYAQSVGGGGGDGGFAATLSRDIVANPKTDLKKSLMNLAVGGNGGDGGDSGNVTVDHTGSIISHGDNSFGVFAQSVSGGGGNSAFALTSPIWMAADLGLSTLIGGRDGANGAVGRVTLNTTGSIIMHGNNSTAQLGQSINGGGGNVHVFLDVSKKAAEFSDDGFELPNNDGLLEKVFGLIKLGTDAASDLAGQAVEATHVGDMYTTGEKSIASLIQSVGGGGGNAEQEVYVSTEANVDLEIALGASNSSSTHGGDVLLNRLGEVGTTGTHSSGSVVQSIGGGGGNLFVLVKRLPGTETEPETKMMRAFTFDEAPGSSDADLAASAAITTMAALGSDGGSASDGGVLDLTYSGDVSTTGDFAYGHILQSIGGGGGKLSLFGSEALDLSLGGTNGASGGGGGIRLDNTGDITTIGTRAHGVILQSIGGGGGAVFTDLEEELVALTLRADNAGNGGAITFTQNGKVLVRGAGSIGIIAQSLGGGGGLVDGWFADSAGGSGSADDVTLDLKDDVFADGAGGIGIFAQSRGEISQGDIQVGLALDKWLYFGANGVGLKMSGGADNRFTNRGMVEGADELSGWTVVAAEGNDLVENHGYLKGQVDLGTGANEFINHLDAMLVPGMQFRLGDAANLLINEGTMRVGDTGLAQRTDMTGSFVQSTTGMSFAELDFGSDMIDQIYMTGAAELAGRLDLRLLNPQLVPSGNHQKVLFHGDTGVTDVGMELITAPSVVILYKLLYPSGFDAVLDYTVDFSPDEGNFGRNLREVGDYFNRIQAPVASAESRVQANQVSALAETIIKLLYDPTVESYKESLSQLGPDFYGEQQAEFVRGSREFGETMMAGGIYQYEMKDERLWFSFGNRETAHSAFDDFKNANFRAEQFTMGYEREFSTEWIGGFGIAMENNYGDGYTGNWTAHGTTEQVGFTLKRDLDRTELQAVMAYSWNTMDTQRIGNVTEPFETDLERDMESFTTMVRASHEYAFDYSYLKPLIDFGHTSLMAGRADENGAGATSLLLGETNESHLWLRPALEAGHNVTLGSGAKIRFHTELGYQYDLLTDDTRVRARFEGAPREIAPMAVPIDLGNFMNANAGIEFTTTNDVVFGVDYTRLIDENYAIDLLNFRMSVAF